MIPAAASLGSVAGCKFVAVSWGLEVGFPVFLVIGVFVLLTCLAGEAKVARDADHGKSHEVSE